MSIIEQTPESEASPPAYGVAPEGLRHRLFTVTEYEMMAEIGIIKPEERVELLDGEIVPMSPMKGRHIRILNLLARLLISMIPEEAGEIGVQIPVRLSDNSEPEPDVVVLKPSLDERIPRASDVLLVLEVSDSSIAGDENRKSRVYAISGISEYWILDARNRTVIVHRDPDVTRAHYRQVSINPVGSTISPLAFPDLKLEVGRMVPPSTDA